MTKLDPLLAAELSAVTSAPGDDAGLDRRVRVTVHFDGDTSRLEEQGLVVESSTGRFAAGWVRLGEVESLAALDAVEYIEAERFLRPQLDRTVPEIRADQVRHHSPPYTGKGVIIGVVDSGIDIFHENFRTPGLSTRIRRIWDQTAPQKITALPASSAGTFELEVRLPDKKLQATASLPFNASADAVRAVLEPLDGIEPGDVVVTGGALPGTPVAVEFTGSYARTDVPRMRVRDHVTGGAVTVTAGREFSSAEIDAALAAPDVPFGHRDNGGHGTFIAGIAAGDGSQAGGCKPAGTFVGVAPEADLIIVKTTSLDPDIASGVEWIFAQASGVPAVVNLSLGGHIGAHDGTTALEQRIDLTLAGTTNRCVVVAAGNERRDRVHAHAAFSANQRLRWALVVPPDDGGEDSLDIWYAGNARLRFTLTPPSGIAGAIGPLDPLDPLVEEVVGGQTVMAFTDLHVPANGKHRIRCYIRPTGVGTISPGEWTVELEELMGHSGEVDAWVDPQLSDPFWAFKASDQSPSRIVAVPGTAHNVITVGAYVLPTADLASHTLAPFSSAGPTADGRLKPDICAPGVGIWAPDIQGPHQSLVCACCLDAYRPSQGTSFAAPHVAGVAALVLERHPGLTFDQIRDRIRASGRAPRPNPVPSLPNSEWGYGRVDALRAVFPELPADAAAVPSAPTISAAERVARLEGAIRADPNGELLAALVAAHVDEVRALLDEHLRVAVAWHRIGGPDLVRGLFTAEDPVAVLTGWHWKEPWATRFLEVLGHCGGPRLRRDIVRFGSTILRRGRAEAA